MNQPKSALRPANRSLSRSRSRNTRSSLTESQRKMRDFTKNEDFSVVETHHIIKFKPNKSRSTSKPPTSERSEKRGAISKARQAIKKRLSKKRKGGTKSKSKSYAVEKGIEASIKFDRNETYLTRSLSKLKPATGSSSDSNRGRSLERRKSFAGVGQSLNLRRSLSMKRSKSLKRSMSMVRSKSLGRRSVSRGRSSTPGFLEKVKSFRRDKSVLSVRSTRSNFSVRSRGFFNNRGGNRFFRFFKRTNKDDSEEVKERIVLIKQVNTPETAPDEDGNAGFFDSMLCSSLDITVCRDLFCRNEEVDEFDSQVTHEDDPRDFGEEKFNQSIMTETFQHKHGNAI